MNEELEWQLFRDAKFALNCSRIELTELDTGEVAFAGTGEIFQDGEGTLRLKCFTTVAPGTPLRGLMDWFAIPAGTLITKRYSARIIAFDMTSWESDNLHLRWSYSQLDIEPIWAVANAKLDHLTQVKNLGPLESAHAMSLLFLEQRLENWMALIGSEFDCGDTSSRVAISVQRTSDVMLTVTSETEHDSNFETRIVEAVRYVLAKVVHASVIDRANGGQRRITFFSPTRLSETRLLPPLLSRSSDEKDSLHELFRKYVSYVSAEGEVDFVHPCSAYLRQACEASANSLEAHAIGLCVAVEGLIGLVPPTSDRGEEKRVAAVIDLMTRFLERLCVSAALRERVKGVLSILRNVRHVDRLQPLMQSGHLDAECYNAWRDLRNKWVHPKPQKLAGFEDDSVVQELLDSIHRVYVCMYQITFARIGYEGKFTDYASRGFKTRHYPLPK